MKSAYFCAFGLMILVNGACSSTVGSGLKDEAEKINYSVGYQIGGDFKSQGVEIRSEALVQGIRDAVSGTTPLMTKAEMDATLVSLKKKIVSDQRAEERRAATAFLTENARRKDVTVLPSGIQYRVLSPGSGRKPTLKDEVKVHYRITRVDGTEIGSTYVGGKARTLPMSAALPGLQEVLQLMQEGSKWQVALPTKTTSGGRDPMDDMGVLIYEVELLSVRPGTQESAKPAVAE